MARCLSFFVVIALGHEVAALGQPLHLPTPNKAIFEPGNEID